MEARVQIRNSVTGQIVHQLKAPVDHNHVFNFPSFAHPIEIVVSCRSRGFHEHANTLHEALRYGMKVNFESEDPGSVDIRKSIEYIKGFNEGAQTVIDHAEARLVGFIRNIYKYTPPPSRYIPNGLQYLEEMCKATLKEWDRFRGKE